MKTGELASALKELGRAFRHARKDEPAPCIMQVLKLLDGHEQLDVSEVVKQTLQKKAAPKKTKKASAFILTAHLEAILKAKSEGEFQAAMLAIRSGKPTNDDLKKLVTEYTGITRKTGTKEDLFRALETAFNAEHRNERRDRVAERNIPV